MIHHRCNQAANVFLHAKMRDSIGECVLLRNASAHAPTRYIHAQEHSDGLYRPARMNLDSARFPAEPLPQLRIVGRYRVRALGYVSFAALTGSHCRCYSMVGLYAPFRVPV